MTDLTTSVQEIVAGRPVDDVVDSLLEFRAVGRAVGAVGRAAGHGFDLWSRHQTLKQRIGQAKKARSGLHKAHEWEKEKAKKAMEWEKRQAHYKAN